MLPKFLQSCLWSYDLSKMTPEGNKETIITQVLNYGDSQAIRWLFKTYKLYELKDVIRKPRRGLWLENAINYWSKILKIKVDPYYYKFCILDVNPNPELWQEFWKDK